MRWWKDRAPTVPRISRVYNVSEIFRRKCRAGMYPVKAIDSACPQQEFVPPAVHVPAYQSRRWFASIVSIFRLIFSSRKPGPSSSNRFATLASSSTRLLGAQPGPSSDLSQRDSSRQFEPNTRLPVAGQRPRQTLK